MPTIHRSRTAIAAAVAALTFALSAPLAVNAEEQVIAEAQVIAAEDPVPALAPVSAAPSAGTTQIPSDVRWAPAGAIAPGSSVEASRVLAAQQALLSPDLGSLQEEALFAIVAAAPSWDATSGYGSVEATRAAATALLAPVADPSWDETSGYGAVEASRAETAEYVMPAAGTTLDGASGSGSVETSRVSAAQHALFTGDIGSMQEERLLAIVAAAPS